jgi:hypothetical protein
MFRKTYELSEKKHIHSKFKTYQTRVYSPVVYAGLQIELQCVKKHITFRKTTYDISEKKHIHSKSKTYQTRLYSPDVYTARAYKSIELSEKKHIT